MTDPTTNLGEIVVYGNRRPAGGAGAYGGGANGGGGGGAGDDGGIHENTLSENPNPEPPYQYDPCNTPEKRFEKKVDAKAADTLKDIKDFAQTNPPTNHGIDEREYGAMLWLMPDGSVERGPISYGEFSFLEAYQNTDPATAGKAFVLLDPTPPDPYAINIGSVHTHNPGSTQLSGSFDNNSQNWVGDQKVLRDNQTYLSQNNRDPALARVYVASQNLADANGTPGVKMSIYNDKNMDQAVGDYVGPEVDPEGQACPPV